MGIGELLLERAERRGFEKGFQEAVVQAKKEMAIIYVQNLLANTDLDDSKIASLTSVDVPFVKDAKAKMGL